ncbi:MAG: tetratricopeptide repeat protein [Candidatus Competibacteraceae bacterium]
MTLPLTSRFFTFYSFKGGVGRTMALLNCAYILAGAGRSVLMVDFDLEAPGLSFLIERTSQSRHRKPAKSPLEKVNGLVELITAFINSPEDWPLGESDSGGRLKEDYMIELEIPKKARIADTKGRLVLLPAGHMGDSYAARLTRIDWRKPPLDKYRDDLFRHIRKLIENLNEFDYILIDSRTGLTDDSYIAARILADHLIVLTGLNDQNIIGTADFLKHVASWPKEEDRIKERRVILVESPVPEWEEQAKHDRHRKVKELFKRYLEVEIPFSHALPYHPLLALREEAIVADWPNSSLGRAYRGLTHNIQELAEDQPERWVQDAFDMLNSLSRTEKGFKVGFGRPINRDFDMDILNKLNSTKNKSKISDLSIVRDALENLRPIDISAFNIASQLAAEVLVDLPKLIKGDIELIQYLVRYNPENALFHRRLARIQQKHKNFEAARETLEQAISLAKKQDDQLALWQIEMDFTELATLENKLTEACVANRRALEVARLINDQSRISKTLYELAILEKSVGNYKEARQNLKEALEIDQSLEDRRGIVAILHELAGLECLQGNYEAARQHFTEVLEIRQSLRQKKQGLASTQYQLAILNLLQKNYEAARQAFKTALDIFQELKYPIWTTYIAFHQEVLEILSGNRNSADPLRSKLENIKAIDNPYWTAQGLLLLAKATQKLGNPDEALNRLREAKELCNQYKLAGYEAEADAALALLLAECGDTRAAAEHAKAAIAFFNAQHVNSPDRPALDRLLPARKPRLQRAVR